MVWFQALPSGLVAEAPWLYEHRIQLRFPVQCTYTVLTIHLTLTAILSIM